MIKFKNINNLYGFNCLNIKVVKMKNETKKQVSPIESATACGAPVKQLSNAYC